MGEPDNEQDQTIGSNLKTLIRGLTQDNVTETYVSYKALFQIGAPDSANVILRRCLYLSRKRGGGEEISKSFLPQMNADGRG